MQLKCSLPLSLLEWPLPLCTLRSIGKALYNLMDLPAQGEQIEPVILRKASRN